MTIEERAKKYADDNSIRFSYRSDVSSYIAGATEQKEIDIEKACEWLHSNCYIDDEYMDRFRKAMEE